MTGVNDKMTTLAIACRQGRRRAQGNLGGLRSPIDQYADLATFFGHLHRYPGQSEALARRWAASGAGYTSDGRTAGDHRNPIIRYQPVLHDEADQLVAQSPVTNGEETGPANEVLLVEADRPFHVAFQRVRHGVGVLPDDDVLLFQAQYSLRLQPERSDVELAARVDDGFP